jgi:hypothetical protein
MGWRKVGGYSRVVWVQETTVTATPQDDGCGFQQRVAGSASCTAMYSLWMMVYYEK